MQQTRLVDDMNKCQKTDILCLPPPPTPLPANCRRSAGSGGRRDILYFHEAPLTAAEERGEEVGWNKFHAAGSRFLPPLITDGRVA